MAEAAALVRKRTRGAERALALLARGQFDAQLGALETEVLSARTAGRSAHAIFADAILHILSSGPAATAEIHQRIRAIHPDLCDDEVDRVIDGRHFGKKWKHAVRTAQQHLRRRGLITRDGKLWRLVA